MMEHSLLDCFGNLEIRIGTIVEAELFREAKKPAYKLTIDFGDHGKKRSSAQITNLYDEETLVGMQVTAVLNLPPKQIANFISECLVLGAVQPSGSVVLLQLERPVANGTKIG